MALKFIPLTVAAVHRETQDAVTLEFNVPAGTDFDYVPGQYLTLKLVVNGKKLNRAYSLCSCPTTDNNPAVTIKKTPGGIASTWVNDYAKAGDVIEALPPMGNFKAKITVNEYKHYLLIGAGSGITPLMSILKSALHHSASNKVSLIYGSRDESQIIFGKKLDELVQKYPGRLNVIHSLSAPSNNWQGNTGRLNGAHLQKLITAVINDLDVDDVFLCGPSGLMEDAFHSLRALDVDPGIIHQEHFSAALPDVDVEDDSRSVTMVTAVEEPGDYDVKIILEGVERVITVNHHESILEAALDNDIDPPYACMIGSCCTCKAKLVSGKVIMDDREGLTDQEIREGFVLTCQSHPVSPGVVLNYDIV
ncbi:MAG: ferredoxin--NADP reductase [Bacteroidota bacterium]|nr:ferredoxin--NADP reductase [Bacteroidota bacterium]